MEKSASYKIGAEMALKEAGLTKEAILPFLAPLVPLLGSMATGAAIGGGINALTAQRGQRMKAFGTGALYGGIGGGVGKAVGMGVGALRGTQAFSKLMGPAEGMGAGKSLFNKAFTPGKMEFASQLLMPNGPKKNQNQQQMSAMPQMKPNPQPMTNLPWMYG